MNNLFYPKLAITNIKKNGKTYIPYIITCICSIVMFYVMHSISLNPGLDGPQGSQALKTILSMGVTVIGIFSAIFLFYTNSFLIKRRKKEIGLYNVLGLEKKHIAYILFFETLFVSIFSIVVGLLGGILLDKLMFMLLLKLLQISVPFGFSISVASIGFTTKVFVCIFLVTLISNLFQITTTNPIELLKGGNHGEKEPKTKIIMTIIGLISLGIGYSIAILVKSPLSALNLFFIAVIFVMIGTYTLFTAGSIALLKALRKNKKFYYKTENFISISGMLYRMKQNAVGLANICILSTAVLVIISTTVSLYIGMEDSLRYRYPKDVKIFSNEISNDEIDLANDIVVKSAQESNISLEDKLNYWENSYAAIRKGDKFILQDYLGYSSDTALIESISLSDYNRLEGKNATLNDNEVLLFSVREDYGKDTLTIEDKVFNVKEELQDFVFATKNPLEITQAYYLVVNDINLINDILQTPQIKAPYYHNYHIEFDLKLSDDEIITFTDKINQSFSENNLILYIDSAAGSKQDFLSLYGGLLFIGIFLGTLFLMATVLIIYYKQISEGYDDKHRFEIMQKVGMSHKEIRKTIRSQILIVFFLPLIFAVIHIAFALPIIMNILAALNLNNVSLFVACTGVTVLIFTVIYAIVYMITAKAYYNIVE